MPARKFFRTKSWLEEQYLDLRKGTCRIAQEQTCDPTTIRDWLKKYEIRVRSRAEANRSQAAYTNRKWLEEQYEELERSVLVISKECRCSHSTICYWLKEFGIEVRSPSESHKHQVAWNKGLTKETDERVRKYSNTKRGRYPWNRGKLPWNKGLVDIFHHSEESIRKMKGRSSPRKGKPWLDRRAENHPNWKGGVTSLVIKIRNCFKYRQWRSDVFTKDNFTCQRCGRRGGFLHAHHEESFGDILELNDIKTYQQAVDCSELWNINNGITLCKRCHKKYHKEQCMLKERIENG